MRQKYGEKVYKIPISIPATCPNRDGFISEGGCIFCGEKGAGFENLPDFMPVQEQLNSNIAYIKNKYGANKYVAYFQNFTNTYLPLSALEQYARLACIESVAEISFATRPDCISDLYLEKLLEISKESGKQVSIELGLQTVNYRTLERINRGHSLAEFIDAVLRIKKYGFEICVHVILNLPWDEEIDIIEMAKILSALEINQVKIHALYIEKETEMCQLFEKKQIDIIPLESYVKRVVLFLEYIAPNIVIQRVAGRAPKEKTVFCNWGTSWWKIRDLIEDKMERLDTRQGAKCNYLNGSALKRFRI